MCLFDITPQNLHVFIDLADYAKFMTLTHERNIVTSLITEKASNFLFSLEEGKTLSEYPDKKFFLLYVCDIDKIDDED